MRHSALILLIMAIACQGCTDTNPRPEATRFPELLPRWVGEGFKWESSDDPEDARQYWIDRTRPWLHGHLIESDGWTVKIVILVELPPDGASEEEMEGRLAIAADVAQRLSGTDLEQILDASRRSIESISNGQAFSPEHAIPNGRHDIYAQAFTHEGQDLLTCVILPYKPARWPPQRP